jgi:hypothetical protein
MKYIDRHTLSRLVVCASIATLVTSILSIYLFATAFLDGYFGRSTQDTALHKLTLKRPSTYMNLDKVSFNSSLGTFPPIHSFAQVLLQLDNSDPSRALRETSRRYQSPVGDIYPNDRFFLVSSSVCISARLRCCSHPQLLFSFEILIMEWNAAFSTLLYPILTRQSLDLILQSKLHEIVWSISGCWTTVRSYHGTPFGHTLLLGRNISIKLDFLERNLIAVTLCVPLCFSPPLNLRVLQKHLNAMSSSGRGRQSLPTVRVYLAMA